MTSQLGLFDLSAPAPEQHSYHVRSHVTVAEVEAGERSARRQESILLAWFRARPGVLATPSQVHAALWDDEGLDWPLTSVRRGITNLTRKGLLRHWPGERRDGPLGRPESTWSLA